MTKGINHDNRLIIIPRRVEVLSPLRTALISQTMHRGITLREKKVGKRSQCPIPCVYIVNPHYRVFVDGTGPVEALDKLEWFIQDGAFHNPPYLGTRECKATVTPVTETPIEPLDIMEPHLPLGNQGPFACVLCRQGVIEYPPEVEEALTKRRYHR